MLLGSLANMGRTLRHQTEPNQCIMIRRKPSPSPTPNSDDDDGYSAVEEISDGEDDDEAGIDAVEAEHIMEESRASSSHSSQPSSDSNNEEEEDEDDRIDDGYDLEGAKAENHTLNDLASDTDDTFSSGSVSHEAAVTAAAPVAVERHVHFADIPCSDSESTDSYNDHTDLFPDIFVDKGILDPSFRREIEHDPSEFHNASFWDCLEVYATSESDTDFPHLRCGAPTPHSTPITSQAPTVVSTPVTNYCEFEMDVYDSDGDTTEEEAPHSPTREKNRRRASNDNSSDSDIDAGGKIFRSPRDKSVRGTPRLGSFNLDRSDRKPIAVVNPVSRKMIIFTPQRRRQFDLSPEQFDLSFFCPFPGNSTHELSTSSDLMLGALSSPTAFDAFLGSQPITSADASFPYTLEGISPDDSASCSVEDEGDAAERNLNISDFISWDQKSTVDEEEGGAEWEYDGPSTLPSVRPASASDDMDAIGHLNSEMVGAFRRNQITQQLLLSEKATQDSLVFSGPYNITALRGIKSDCMEKASAPLTPIRRQQRPFRELSRILTDSVAQKRKASTESTFGHKRQRSISDVNLLHI